MRSDADEARRHLEGLTPSEVANVLQEVDHPLRAEVLALAEHAAEVVPLLPETELVTTIRAAGMAEASWLVGLASPEQRVACVDLDCWKDFRLSPSRLAEWIDALIEAGTETLVAAFRELDPELWIVAMRQMANFAVRGIGATGPAEYTEDGLVFYGPHSDADEERVRAILGTALTESPSHYWHFVLGAIGDSDGESREFAERWHRARLNDLGFPDRDHAMRAYRPLTPEQAPAADVGPRRATETRDVVAAPHLPQRLAGTLVGRALAELPADRAGELLGYVLAVANTVAVADELPLSEPESIRLALAKAVHGIDRGLAELARVREISAADVLDRTAPLDLFRIGATLDPTLRLTRSLADLDDADESPDWNLEFEVIAEEDRTIRDGAPTGAREPPEPE